MSNRKNRKRYTLAELLQGATAEVMAALNEDIAWSLDIEPVGREIEQLCETGKYQKSRLCCDIPQLKKLRLSKFGQAGHFRQASRNSGKLTRPL